jgi:hypothetical protein
MSEVRTMKLKVLHLASSGCEAGFSLFPRVKTERNFTL